MPLDRETEGILRCSGSGAWDKAPAGQMRHTEPPMRIAPWRASCIQMRSKLSVKAADRLGAWAIVKENIDHALGLIDAATQSAEPPALVVLPEFALQGPPHGLPAADWIKKACCAIPGRISAPLQNLARRAHIYIAAHQF